MRQIGGEKDDPLKRIQEEINEVARREQELREKMHSQKNSQQPVDSNDRETISQAEEASNCAGADETHSDDSGISASSSPIHGTSANKPKYTRPNSYAPTTKSNQQKFLLRATSTPQIALTGRRFNISPAQKGIMQRFIATRGKLAPSQSQGNQYVPAAVIPGREAGNAMIPLELNRSNLDFLKGPMLTPPIIERDADGRPIRRGYVPVEEKIQRELRDLKSRETELKRQRKLRQSQPDLLDSIEDEEYQSDDSDVEHCFAPGKLRATKSISELCDDTNHLSPRITPSPNFDRKPHNYNHAGLRPALSLAQLCDLDPEEAPSSHDLIAKWESLIQKNA